MTEKILDGMSDEQKLSVINDYRARNGWPPLAKLGARDPRAVAKLTVKEMCEIKAFRFCGVPNEIIASVFDVTPLTVTRINGANEKKYPRVFVEVMSFNSVREFCNATITEDNERAVRELYPQYRRP
jgi:hypothetical protein